MARKRVDGHGFSAGAKIKRIKVSLAEPKVALTQIGILLVSESQKAFREQAWNDKAWKPRGSPNVMGIVADIDAGKKPPKRRFDVRPALKDTGALSKSIAFEVMSSRSVRVGTTIGYGKVHQTGGKTKGPRITAKIQQGLWKWLKRQDKGVRAKLGWLLNRKFRGRRLETKVPKRQFLGLTKPMVKAVRKIIGIHVMETKR